MTHVVHATWPAPGTPVDPIELEAVLDGFDEFYDPAVARTLDVAEATADKARAVGLARETR
jgi:hypothetical protein